MLARSDLPGFGKSDPVVVTGPRAAYNARIVSGFLKQLDVPTAQMPSYLHWKCGTAPYCFVGGPSA